MDEEAYRKILLRQQFFANLLKILICAAADLPEDSGPAASLKKISEEIDETLFPKIAERNGNMICPKCGSESVEVQVFQENRASVARTKTKTKTKQVGHGCLWWLMIGWWWWIVELMLWVFAFVPMLISKILKKKKYKSTGSSQTVTKHNVTYKKVCVCQDCGHSWKI